jgi:phytoene dehydrogenase-like protein
LVRAFRPGLLGAAPYLFSKIADLLPKKRSPLLKPFLDAQLLISAQTTSDHTNVLYGSAALDLPRRGVKYIEGGMGTISKLLAEWIRQQGGEVRYRQQVTQLISKNGMITGVMTNKGLSLQGDHFIANLTPAGLRKLISEPENRFDSRKNNASTGWGAFMLYVGADQSVIPIDTASHLQVIADPDKPLGEGNSVFISISPAEDTNRAPAGKTAISVSTHTDIHPWWALANQNPDAYEARKRDYTERVLSAMEMVLPDIRTKSNLILPGTPVTFQFYTRRPNGLVGGNPQESLFSVRGPGTKFNNLWLVGDSIFPGQSTAAVTIGAQRVARLVKRTGLVP